MCGRRAGSHLVPLPHRLSDLHNWRRGQCFVSFVCDIRYHYIGSTENGDSSEDKDILIIILVDFVYYDESLILRIRPNLFQVFVDEYVIDRVL